MNLDNHFTEILALILCLIGLTGVSRSLRGLISMSLMIILVSSIRSHSFFAAAIILSPLLSAITLFSISARATSYTLSRVSLILQVITVYVLLGRETGQFLTGVIFAYSLLQALGARSLSDFILPIELLCSVVTYSILQADHFYVALLFTTLKEIVKLCSLQWVSTYMKMYGLKYEELKMLRG